MLCKQSKDELGGVAAWGDKRFLRWATRWTMLHRPHAPSALSLSLHSKPTKTKKNSSDEQRDERCCSINHKYTHQFPFLSFSVFSPLLSLPIIILAHYNCSKFHQPHLLFSPLSLSLQPVSSTQSQPPFRSMLINYLIFEQVHGLYFPFWIFVTSESSESAI